MSPLLIDTLYLLSTGLILFGAWSFLTRDRAVRGAIVVACGLLLAILCTLAAEEIISHGTALVGLALGGALGAFFARGTTPDLEPGRLALLIACSSLAVALVSPIRLHEVGAAFDARAHALDEEWKDLPDAVRRANAKAETVRVPLRITMPAVMATLLGGVAAGASVISALKLSRSPIRKSLPKLEEPRMPQVGAGVVALLLAMLFTAWPLMETFLWLELLIGLGLGYLLTIHLKIADVPPVLAVALATSGFALSAAHQRS
jgi:NAD/NADP transhydrogenase beta subunit